MVIAIDPGANGAIAYCSDDGTVLVEPMPKIPTEQEALLRHLKDHKLGPVIMEKTGNYMPGNSGPASVKFARHCGILEGIIIALKLPLIEVAPSKWMKAMGAISKEKAQRKRDIKELMQKRFPHLKVTLKNADALGILVWYQERDKK